MKTAFTYYGREYELGFSEETGEGLIEWVDGLYNESRSFSVLNDTVKFRPRGKMTREESKAWSKRKTDALKAIIWECIETSEQS